MANIGTATQKYGTALKEKVAKGGEIIPSGYKKTRVQNYTPEQMKLHEDQYQYLDPDSYLAKLAGGDQSFFDELEAPAHRQFNELQGGIASRFSGQGMGGRKNSGFQNVQNQAASNFAQDLQSKRMDLRSQAIKDLMNMSNTLLNQEPYTTALEKKQHEVPLWKKAIGLISPLGGDIAEGDTKNTENFFNLMRNFSGDGSSASSNTGSSWNSQGGNTQMQTQRLTR